MLTTQHMALISLIILAMWIYERFFVRAYYQFVLTQHVTFLSLLHSTVKMFLDFSLPEEESKKVSHTLHEIMKLPYVDMAIKSINVTPRPFYTFFTLLSVKAKKHFGGKDDN